MKKGLLIILGLVGFAPILWGDSSAVALYQQGNALYSQGKFSEAISFYEKALALGIHNSNLYYNLGNAYYKAGERGKAALNWWRAERLNPRDPDLRANLELLEQELPERIPERTQSPVNKFFRHFRDLGSVKRWGIALSVCIWGFWLSLFFYLVFWRRKIRPIFLILTSVFLLGGFLTALGFGFRFRFENQPSAVVMRQEVKARSGPGEEFPVLFELWEGSRVLIRDCRSGYCEIELPPGIVGWVEGGALERI